MDNEISQQILKEPRGDSWARKFADAKAFAESYKTNVVVLDKQKFIDELNAQHTNSPTMRSSEPPSAAAASVRSP